MRTFITLSMVVLLMASCEMYVVDPYDRDFRDQYTGSYEMDEFSETYRDYMYYKIDVTYGYADNEIMLHNFYNLGYDYYVVAYIEGSHISIPYQVVDGYEIKGYGSLTRNEMDFHYSVVDRYHHCPTDFCETQALRIYR